MSFDLLPADLIVKIFHQLPFKDRVRLGGVCRMFRDASEESICKMKSLVVDDDLMAYLFWNQPFSSLLESCSQTLESMEVNNQSCGKSFLNGLAEFVYPKLEQLKITVHCIDDGQMKKLISRGPNLRSIVLHLKFKMECPDDTVFEKLDNLKIHIPNDPYQRPDIDLSPTLRPLIGKIPNLKKLIMRSEVNQAPLHEISQLLASTPSLEKLDLEFYGIQTITSGIFFQEFNAAVATWRLPKLTDLAMDFNIDTPAQSSIIQLLPASFPRLESFTLYAIEEIDDQALLAIQQMKNLRELNLRGSHMTKAQIVDLITSVPSLFDLTVKKISDVSSPETFIEFLSSTAAIFRRDVYLYMTNMEFPGSQQQLKSVLKEMEDEGGPAVSCYMGVDGLVVYWIRYKSLTVVLRTSQFASLLFGSSSFSVVFCSASVSSFSVQ